jgi:DnaJ-class molecular chaperone
MSDKTLPWEGLNSKDSRACQHCGGSGYDIHDRGKLAQRQCPWCYGSGASAVAINPAAKQQCECGRCPYPGPCPAGKA